jgi:hypothetical protein
VLLLAAYGVLASQSWGIVRTAHIELTIPAREDPRRIADALERAYEDIRMRGFSLPATVRVRAHRSTGEFARAARASRGHIGAFRDGVLHLQPLSVLLARRWYERSFRHELVHVALLNAEEGGLPRWLNEGLAAVAAGETYRRGAQPTRITSAEALDRALARSASPESMIAAYAAAEQLARRLVARHGWPSVVAMVDGAQEVGFDVCFKRLTGIPQEQWAARELAEARKDR